VESIETDPNACLGEKKNRVKGATKKGQPRPDVLFSEIVDRNMGKAIKNPAENRVVVQKINKKEMKFRQDDNRGGGGVTDCQETPRKMQKGGKKHRGKRLV